MEWLGSNLAQVPNLLAGAAVIIVGVWVFLLGSRALFGRLLGITLASYGLAVALFAVGRGIPANPAIEAASLVAAVHTAVAVALLSFVFPRPMRPWLASARILVVPALVAVGGAFSMAAHRAADFAGAPVGWALAAEGLVSSVASVVFPWRLSREARDGPRHSLLLLTIATLALGTHFRVRGATRAFLSGGVYGTGPADPFLVGAHVVGAAASVVGFVILVRASLGPDRDLARLTRVGAAVVPLALTTGILSGLGWGAAWDEVGAVWRLLFAVLVAWGVLRQSFPGVDSKMRLALSRGSVAALFVTVFFVASEMAQQFFGETSGSAYIGIAAAGLFVFVLAPLQRVADRLADRTLPGDSSPAGLGDDRAEAAYRRALYVALRDRAISREEEAELWNLADDLGIRAGRAAAIRRDVEKARPGPPRSRARSPRADSQ